jgi:hypothetical protein
LVLRDNLGTATFNTRTQVLDFPPAVPQSRFPKKGLKKGKKIKGLVGSVRAYDHQASSTVGNSDATVNLN